MLRFSRRPSDTCGFLVLYWFSVIIALVGLGLFASDRIIMIKGRQHFLQSKTEYAESGTTSFDINIPDFVFCTYNATVEDFDDRYTYETIKLTENVPKDKMVKSPCWNGEGDNDFNYMHIYRSVDRVIDAADEDVDPRLRFTFLSAFNTTNWNRAAFFVLSREQLNQYYPTSYVDAYDLQPNPELQQNMHYLSEGEVNAYISVSVEKTEVLADGFLGYFNVHDESKAKYMVFSSAVLAYEEGKTWIGIILPLKKTTHSQILTMSIHGAIASFGGVLSIVSAGLIFFFGSKRVTPFGVVQKWFMRGSTRENLMKAYGNWEDAGDLLGGLLDKRDKGSSNFIDEKRGTDFSIDVEEKPEKDRSRDIQENPVQKDRSRDTQVKQAPTDLPPANQPSLNEEMNSFRRQMQAQEIRVREMEALLKTYYLDMDLVGAKEDRSDKRKDQRASRMETMVEIGDALKELSS